MMCRNSLLHRDVFFCFKTLLAMFYENYVINDEVLNF